jgi:hypothetical protein
MPIFCIGRLKTTDTNNELLVSGGKSTIIDISYCYQPTPIIDHSVTKVFLVVYATRLEHMHASERCRVTGESIGSY